MQPTLTTQRLWLRGFAPNDAHHLFALDTDPDVVRYTGVPPLTHMDQAHQGIAHIRQQYQDFGMGRWAVFVQGSDAFVGWAGLKFITEHHGRHNVHGLGYRLLKAHWSKGYGSELAQACLRHGFEAMKLARISATVDPRNPASVKILEKCGMRLSHHFMDEGDRCAWYELDNPGLAAAHGA